MTGWPWPCAMPPGPRMKTFHVLPAPALRPFVDRIWGWESTGGAPVPLPTLLPGTGAELYLHYGAPFRYLAPDDAGRLEVAEPVGEQVGRQPRQAGSQVAVPGRADEELAHDEEVPPVTHRVEGAGEPAVLAVGLHRHLLVFLK